MGIDGHAIAVFRARCKALPDIELPPAGNMAIRAPIRGRLEKSPAMPFYIGA
jgi:hypothetical protein